MDLPPPTSAKMALEQVALITSRMLAGLIDIDSANAAINGLKVYLAGLGDTTFEERLKRCEILVNNPSAVLGDAPGGENPPTANGHNANGLHNGHAVEDS
jgi:hypothetical protein